jgi:transcriptional regulator with XRE-family HTH domain
MSMLNANFGQVIRDRRRHREMTQQEVASKVGTSTPYVGHLESGKRHPSDEILTRIADVLGFDRRELFFLANPHAKELLHPAEPVKATSAWEEFQRDNQLRKIHDINAREMKMLAQVALMGRVRSSRDFIYILNTVRQALIS